MSEISTEMLDRGVDKKDCVICKLQEMHQLCESHHSGRDASKELIVEYLKLKALTDIVKLLDTIDTTLINAS